MLFFLGGGRYFGGLMGALKVRDGWLSVSRSSGGELTENRTLFEVWCSLPPLINHDKIWKKKWSFSSPNQPHVKFTFCIDFMKIKKTRTSEVSKSIWEKTDVLWNTKSCSRIEIVNFTLKWSFFSKIKKGLYKRRFCSISRPKSLFSLSYGIAYGH